MARIALKYWIECRIRSTLSERSMLVFTSYVYPLHSMM